MIKTLQILIPVLLFISCSVEPKPIDFGKDMCVFCKMSIVDKQHAAELVTSKGKIYVFDAIECMVQYLHVEDKTTEYAHYLVCDFDQPGVLVDAQKATYLISDAIPSPMGAFLSGFSDPLRARQMKEIKGGVLYDWTSLSNQIKIN